MNLIRKSAWAAVVLGAVAGCNDESATTTTPPSNPPAVGRPDAPSRPIVPAPGAAGASKEGTSKEMQPPPISPADAKKSGESPKLEGPKSEAGKGDTAAAKLSADEITAIKELPAAEQEQALKQAVCPVSNHNLGEMGKPVKVSAEGRTFYLCCEDCEKEVKSNAKAVIAKLDARAGKK
jgi:hypothetical protein